MFKSYDLPDRRTAEHLTHLHIVKFFVDLPYLLHCQGDVGSPDIFLQAAEVACARDRNYPWTFTQHPSKSNLRRCGMILFGKTVEQCEQGAVLVETLLTDCGMEAR